MPSYSARRRRRITRRDQRTRCQAVASRDFRLLGDRVLDMSPFGLLVAADDGADVGDEVIVSFRAPGGSEWLDAEAEVVRIVEGWRPGDPGYCIGLRFTSIGLDSRMLLRERLHGVPPPVPQRPLRSDSPAAPAVNI